MQVTQIVKDNIQKILIYKSNYEAATKTKNTSLMDAIKDAAYKIYLLLPIDIVSKLNNYTYDEALKYFNTFTVEETITVIPSVTIYPTLKKGSSGSFVLIAQNKLQYHGYSPGSIDGIFGVNTEEAVILFQKSRDLSPDGIIGKNTWDKLLTDVIIPIKPLVPDIPVIVSRETLPIIKIDSSGEYVKFLQQVLTNLGYPCGFIDGIFGIKTENALKLYQTSRGLTPDGICGKITWDAISTNKQQVEVVTSPILENNIIPDGTYLNWQYIIIHHTAAEEFNTEQVRQYHKSKGWIDIGYNFVVEKDGTIGIGRSLSIQGAHCDVDGMNKKGIGISVIGNFDLREIEDIQYNSLLLITRQVMSKFNIPVKNVLGHREVQGAATACPGKNIDIDVFRLNLTKTGIVNLSDDTDNYITQYNTTDINEMDIENNLKGISNILLSGAYTLLKID